MKLLVWECPCCRSRTCILPFDGKKNSCGFERPELCIRDATCGTDPWVLKKVDDDYILNWYRKANEKWKNNKKK